MDNLEFLTEKQRKIYTLHLSGKKQSLIAKELGLSRQYVSKAIKDSEERLKKIKDGWMPPKKRKK
ncbi:MAG: hypothetical protein K2M46_14505 [Lachnospiraceae bacterium]|nr:hypothetical protein [Lachnospiraceae bacterium]